MKTSNNILDIFSSLLMLCLVAILGFGLFLAIPVLLIQWGWNAAMTSFPVLPLINIWQSGLLYVALVTLLHILGVVRLEFSIEDGDE